MNQRKPSSELYENLQKSIYTIRFRVKPNMAPPTFRMHWHEDIEIQYIIEGTNIARCDNDIVEATEDSFFIINSAEIHQSIGGNRRHACIQFSPSLFGKNNIILKRIVRDPYLSELMKKMLIEHDKNDEFSKINIQGYAHLLIAHLYKNHAYKIIDDNDLSIHSRKQVILNNCIMYIYDNYDKLISLEELATIADVNKYYFCSIFKEFTGKTFKEYQNNIRVTKAIELLVTTDLPVTEIGFLCGFNDSNYFSRKFRQITGKTPSVTRDELREKTQQL